jgi:hypothetical protein
MEFSIRPRSCEFISLNEWQDFVDVHPQSTPLHDRRWIELLVSQYGFDLVLPAIRCDGQLRAATVFAKTQSFLRGSSLVSMPFTDCFTPLGANSAAIGEMMEWLAGNADVSQISTRMDRPLDGFKYNKPWLRHRIALTPEMQELLPLLPAAVRRTVRQATKNGLTFERSTSVNAVDDFYRLHVMTRRKLGVPVQAKSFFRRMHSTAIESGLAFVGMVRSGRIPVAAGIFFNDSRTMMYKYGASDPSALSLRPNDLMFLNAIQLAAREHQFFDFGVTHAEDEGLCRFKRKWGADEEEIYDVCIAGKPRAIARDSRVVKAASVVIRRSPMFLCRALGHMFYRFGV